MPSRGLLMVTVTCVQCCVQDLMWRLCGHPPCLRWQHLVVSSRDLPMMVDDDDSTQVPYKPVYFRVCGVYLKVPYNAPIET